VGVSERFCVSLFNTSACHFDATLMVMLVQLSQRVQGGHSTQSSSSLFVNIDSPPPHISAAGKRSGRSTSPAAASGKRRSRKEPLRAEYQTEDEYTSAYSQWREFRSKQAESVNRLGRPHNPPTLCTAIAAHVSDTGPQSDLSHVPQLSSVIDGGQFSPSSPFLPPPPPHTRPRFRSARLDHEQRQNGKITSKT
jgi:hypothetical protein